MRELALHSDRYKSMRRVGTLAALFLLSAGNCGQAATVGQNIAAFPDPRDATLKEGLFVPVDAVRLIAQGMTKRQIRAVLGAPHFHEGLIGERTWDFILNFYVGNTRDYIVCQYQLNFGRDHKLAVAAWNAPRCEALIAAAPFLQAVAAVNPQPSPSLQREVTVHFAFGAASLSPDALAILDDLGQSIAGTESDVDVVGYTDRAGSAQYNDVLSLERARTVAKALRNRGIASERLHISGRGERDPVIDTPDGVAEMHNRRSEVKIKF